MVDNKTIEDNLAKAEEHLDLARQNASLSNKQSVHDNYGLILSTEAIYHATMANNYLLKALFAKQQKTD